MTARFSKQCFARMIRWETIDLVVVHGGLLLDLRCDAWDSHLYSDGRKRSGFKLSDDDADRSVLAAFQLWQSGWGQPGLPGWRSLVDKTDVKSLSRRAYAIGRPLSIAGLPSRHGQMP